MENNKPKTIDEFFIEKYQKLEEDNNRLKSNVEFLKVLVKTQEEETESWKNTYYELVERLKEDYRIEIERASTLSGETHYISINGVWIWKSSQKEKYEYYKNVFNLKEKGEEDEQKCSENNQA